MKVMWIWVGDHHYLSENVPLPPNNEVINNISEVNKAVMSSAVEAKFVLLYITACKAIKIRNILKEIGHPQPMTPMQTNNFMAKDIINSRVQQKPRKAINMCFYWLHNRGVWQNNFVSFRDQELLPMGTIGQNITYPPMYHAIRIPDNLEKLLELQAHNAYSPAKVF